MTTVREAPRADEARLQRLASRTQHQPLVRLANHEHPKFGGWQADGEERQDWIATMLMEAYRETRDPEAIAMLYDLYAPIFRRMIRARLRTGRVGKEVDDLLQEVYVAICRYPDGFHADRAHAFRCWAVRIVYNTINTAARARRRRRAHIESQDLRKLSVASTTPTPELAATEREAMAAADQTYRLFLLAYLHAYQQLSDSDRHLLGLVELEHRSYTELEDELGVARSALKVRVFRARKRIATRMQAALDEALHAA